MAIRTFTKMLVGFLLGLLSFGFFADRAESAGTLYRDVPIVHQGITRTFHYYIPEKMLRHPPLVFMFHGYGGSADIMFGTDPGHENFPWRIMMEVADNIGFLLCAPNGVGPDGVAGTPQAGWNDCRDIPSNPTTDDVGLVEALITWFSGRFRIDKDRVYAAGMSNGAHMALRLAIELGDKIAAVGAVCGAMPDPAQSKCGGPSEKVGVLFMAGTIDPLLPFAGGEMYGKRGKVLSNADSVALWVARNGTETTPHVYEFPDLNTTDGGGIPVLNIPVLNSTVIRSIYPKGKQGSAVANYVVVNGGHAEPSIAEQYDDAGSYQQFVGRQNNDVELADELWKFFVTQTRKERKKFDLALFRTLLWQLGPEFSQVVPEEWGVK